MAGSASDADIEVGVRAGEKRSRDVSEDGEPASKRTRLDEDEVGGRTSSSVSPCLAPKPSEEIRSLLQRVEDGDYELFAGDLFLTEDFRDRWCKCSSVRPTIRYSRRTVLERDFSISVRRHWTPTLTSSLRKRPTNHPQIRIQVRAVLFLFCWRSILTHMRVPYWVPGLSLEELGLRALERIPRDRAIDGIQAFMDMRFVSIVAHDFSCSHLTSAH